MATSLPYVVAPKNIDPLFSRIASAKVPDAFTQTFLYQTIGLKGSNDRALIPLLRWLGFIDAAGNPTPSYSALKNPGRFKTAIAEGIRTAYAPLYEANEKVHELPQDQLKGLIAQVAGTDQDLTGRIAGTFNALVRLADFASEPEGDVETSPKTEPAVTDRKPPLEEKPKASALRPEFHYNIQVHLPANATEEVYLSIFNALRKSFT